MRLKFPINWETKENSLGDLQFIIPPLEEDGIHIQFKPYTVLHLRWQKDKEKYIQKEARDVFLAWYILLPILLRTNKEWIPQTYQGDISGPFCIIQKNYPGHDSRSFDLIRASLRENSDGTLIFWTGCPLLDNNTNNMVHYINQDLSDLEEIVGKCLARRTEELQLFLKSLMEINF